VLVSGSWAEGGWLSLGSGGKGHRGGGGGGSFQEGSDEGSVDTT